MRNLKEPVRRSPRATPTGTRPNQRASRASDRPEGLTSAPSWYPTPRGTPEPKDSQNTASRPGTHANTHVATGLSRPNSSTTPREVTHQSLGQDLASWPATIKAVQLVRDWSDYEPSPHPKTHPRHPASEDTWLRGHTAHLKRASVYPGQPRQTRRLDATYALWPKPDHAQGAVLAGCELRALPTASHPKAGHFG